MLFISNFCDTLRYLYQTLEVYMIYCWWYSNRRHLDNPDYWIISHGFAWYFYLGWGTNYPQLWPKPVVIIKWTIFNSSPHVSSWRGLLWFHYILRRIVKQARFSDVACSLFLKTANKNPIAGKFPKHFGNFPKHTPQC